MYNNISDCPDTEKVVTCYVDDGIRKSATPDICTSRVSTGSCTITITDSTVVSSTCTAVITIKQL